MSSGLIFVLGVLTGVCATLGVGFIVTLVNWLLAEHDYEEADDEPALFV